jgi:Transposase DDE domain
VQYCNREACRDCELKPQCTANTYRRVGRWTEEAVLERMEARLAARPEILKQRREIAEHPFGSIKQWMNQGTFLLRGLEKVRSRPSRWWKLQVGLRWPSVMRLAVESALGSCR